MSLLSYFKANSLATAEDTGVGGKATEEVNIRVAEILLCEEGKHRCKPTMHSEETRAKLGKYIAINGLTLASEYFLYEFDHTVLILQSNLPLPQWYCVTSYFC